MQLSAQTTGTAYFFPDGVADIVKGYLWGTPQTWRHAYQSVLDSLPKYTRTLLTLHPTPYCHAKTPGQPCVLDCLDEIADCVYCMTCGEKTEWCFSSMLGWTSRDGGACEICEYYLK